MFFVNRNMNWSQRVSQLSFFSIHSSKGSSSDAFTDFEVIDEEFVDKHCVPDNKPRAITQGIHLDHIGYGSMPTDCNIIDYIHFGKLSNYMKVE